MFQTRIVQIMSWFEDKRVFLFINPETKWQKSTIYRILDRWIEEGISLKREIHYTSFTDYADGLEQGCSNCIDNALELLNSYTKPLMW